MTRSHTQRGSAIFMIFVAVALFGALSYAFLRGSRSNVTMMTDEQAKVYAQQIISYGGDTATAVKRLLLRGVPENQINFFNSIYKTGADILIVSNNPLSTSASQNIYSTEGGGIFPVIINEDAMDTTYRTTANPKVGHYYIRSIEVVGTRSSAKDVVLVLEGVNKSVCLKINEVLGLASLDSYPSDTPAGWTSTYWLFDGTGLIGDEATYIAGKSSFCMKQSTTFTYIQILLNR